MMSIENGLNRKFENKNARKISPETFLNLKNLLIYRFYLLFELERQQQTIKQQIIEQQQKAKIVKILEIVKKDTTHKEREAALKNDPLLLKGIETNDYEATKKWFGELKKPQ